MISVGEIAKSVSGKVVGDESVQITGLSSYTFAKEGDMTFAFSEDDLQKAGKTKAACVMTPVEVENYSKPILYVKDMKTAMTMVYNAMVGLAKPPKGSIAPSVVVSESAELGDNVTLGPNVVVGDNTTIGSNTVIQANTVIGKNVTIGENTVLHPNVTIYDQSLLGNKVIIHSGTVIGADGFGFIPMGGQMYKVPQIGYVIIEDNVEIGANTCVDRGTFTSTVIGEGSKLDNLIQIAHNDKLGKNVVMAAQSGIAGSTVVGDNTMMGGGVGVGDHVKLGKNVKIGGHSGVHGKVPDNTTMMGFPAREANDFKKLWVAESLLIKHGKKIKALLRSIPDVE